MAQKCQTWGRHNCNTCLSLSLLRHRPMRSFASSGLHQPIQQAHRTHADILDTQWHRSAKHGIRNTYSVFAAWASRAQIHIRMSYRMRIWYLTPHIPNVSEFDIRKTWMFPHCFRTLLKCPPEQSGLSHGMVSC